MKVLLFNSSSHQQGCTFTALSIIAKALNEEGIDGYRFVTFWNAAYEKEVYDNSNTIPSEAKPHKCYIRIDKQ